MMEAKIKKAVIHLAKLLCRTIPVIILSCQHYVNLNAGMVCLIKMPSIMKNAMTEIRMIPIHAPLCVKS